MATATSPSRPAPRSSTPAAAPLRAADRAPSPVAIAAIARAVARDLLGEQLGVLAGGEADDLQAIGMRVDDRERALADRAGRAEDGDALHATHLGSGQPSAVAFTQTM